MGIILVEFERHCTERDHRNVSKVTIKESWHDRQPQGKARLLRHTTSDLATGDDRKEAGRHLSLEQGTKVYVEKDVSRS